MIGDATRVGAPPAALAPARWARRRASLRRFARQQPLACAGLAVLLLLLVIALRPELFTVYNPIEVNPAERLRPPSGAHPFGTDHLGRDLFARVLYGARVSLSVALSVVAVATLAGCALGAAAGYGPTWLDETIMRASEMFIAFPLMVLAMAVVAALGPGLNNVMLALMAIWWAQYARLMRSQVVTVKHREFVQAARVLGGADARIVGRHIIPNCLSPIIVKATVDIGVAVLLAAGLSFLGLGARPPTPEWGAMITDGRNFLLTAWWYPTFPGLAIFVTVMAINLVGDALRDILDPRLRSA